MVERMQPQIEEEKKEFGTNSFASSYEESVLDKYSDEDDSGVSASHEAL